jgi:diguanylate cyclase (GGDEF)-like protein
VTSAEEPVVTGTDKPPARIALNLAPFAAAWALTLGTVLTLSSIEWAQFAVAVTLGIVAGASRLAPWPASLTGARETFPSLIFLCAVAFLRSSGGGANSGIAVVALLPVFWTALHGNRRQLAAVTLGLAVFFLAPLVLLGGPEYPASQYRAGMLFLAVSAIIGFTTQRLMTHVRFQASEAEQREHMLERIAAVMRGLSNSPGARAEVCEAAKTISNASVAILFEPWGVPGGLRSTAMAGISMAPIEIQPEDRSPARDAFLSRQSAFVSADDEIELVRREVWESIGSPSSLLFEPVFRGTEPVGVLVVGWPQTITVGGSRATAIALLAHEVGAAIERADLLTRLTDMASTDALTGLPNRRAWDLNLNRALAKEEQLAIAMLDFDHFKDFNDSRGHPAGDRLLKESAAAWVGELRSGDLLARIGGEEFALLLPKCSPADALHVVERLRERVPSEQTCSAGIVMHLPGENAESLMKRVDAVLYEAKDAGRNCVSVSA